MALKHCYLHHQVTDTVVMVFPSSFGFNIQTAATNVHQQSLPDLSPESIRNQAIREFEQSVGILNLHGIKTIVLPSPVDVETPDAVFPNNWLTTHYTQNGSLAIYPMLTPNRRAERCVAELQKKLRSYGFHIDTIHDFSHWEQDEKIVEGTGSLVFAHDSGIAFASESPRTNIELAREITNELGYQLINFQAKEFTIDGSPVYHTNVVMSIGRKFAVVCLDAIEHADEREQVKDVLHNSGRELIPITVAQMTEYCGNLLECMDGQRGVSKIVMSHRAMNVLRSWQTTKLQQYGDIVPLPIDTIETVGGGSARCMLAEIFLPIGD